MKYPRTYHLPYSPGSTKGDKKLHGDWFKNYIGQEIVITEKLDGENCAMNKTDVYARSHGAPTRSPWSKNLWDTNGLYWKVKDLIGDNETIYGENLYGEHSIHYDRLTDYFHLFAINNGTDWFSWDDVKMMAKFMNIPTVPELYRGRFYSEDELKNKIEELENQPSLYGKECEGVVIRLADSFKIDDFSKYVCKWVRPNHVQTDEHWTKNWTRALLTNGIKDLPKSITYNKIEYKLEISQYKEGDLKDWWEYRYYNEKWPKPIEVKDSVRHEGYFLISVAPEMKRAYDDILEKVRGIRLDDPNFVLCGYD